MGDQDRSSRSEELLDLLLDALIERQRLRAAQTPPAQTPPAQTRGAEAGKPPARPRPEVRAAPAAPAAPAAEAAAASAPREPRPLPAPRPSIGMDSLLRRMLIGLLLAVVLINIPVAAHGVSLARLLPDSAALVVRDGLVLKGSDDRIYMLQDEQLRWISSLEAFEHLGLDWEDVHVVEDAFLERFETGRPIDVLLKCDGSPHIYLLQDGAKRWIRDIETFEAQGYVWEDVLFTSCVELRRLPDGEPIPSDAWPVPQP